MHSITSFARDCFLEIKEIITEREIRSLKNNDEYGCRQLEEHLVLSNSRRAFVFSVLQLISGAIFFILALTEGETASQAAFLKIIGSVVLTASSVLLLLFYKSELSGHKYDFGRLRIVFYLFWNMFTIGGFFISAGFYHSEKTAYVFLIFFASVLAVPVFRLYENLIAAAIYLIPCIYYGVSEKSGAGFYITVALSLAVFVWINALKTDYYAKKWISRKKLKEASERCTSISQTDTLTGMLNRTGLAAKFRERYGSGGKGHRIAVIMADIDNFRFYNHKFGYDRSDGVLYNICNCIRIISKPVTDMVSRFGGDDFILVLEDMDELEVVKFAEQVRSAVETMALPFGENGIVTISIGVSAITELESEDTYSKLLNEADLQLMIAKNSGKNCIGYRNRAFIQENRRIKEN